MSFSTAESAVQGVPVLHLAGEVDLASVAEFEERLAELLERSAALVVVDLTAVSFLDSGGLKVLDYGQRRAASRGARIALACPHARMLRLLEITGMDDMFAIHPGVEGACASPQ